MSYAWTAFFRAAKVVKVVACSDGDSGGEGEGGAPGGEGIMHAARGEDWRQLC